MKASKHWPPWERMIWFAIRQAEWDKWYKEQDRKERKRKKQNKAVGRWYFSHADLIGR